MEAEMGTPVYYHKHTWFAKAHLVGEVWQNNVRADYTELDILAMVCSIRALF